MCEECNFGINCLQASAGVFVYLYPKRTKKGPNTQLKNFLFFYKH